MSVTEKETRHLLRPAFFLPQSGKQTPLGMQSVSPRYFSILFSFSPQRDPFVRPSSLAVGVKKSSRRLVSCQNNTSRHRQKDRGALQSTLLFPCLSLCHSLRARCGSLHSLAGSPKHHLGRQGWKGWLLEIGTLLTNPPPLPFHSTSLWVPLTKVE